MINYTIELTQKNGTVLTFIYTAEHKNAAINKLVNSIDIDNIVTINIIEP